MKAITIRQPWASLIAIGHKRRELRDWTTRYRGMLVIHAAAALDHAACDALTPAEVRALRAAGFADRHDLPLGALICACDLTDIGPATEDELRRFGGRYRHAWGLQVVAAPATPWTNATPGLIRARGALGLWDVERGREAAAAWGGTSQG